MFKNTNLAVSVRLAIASTALAATVYGPVSLAQEAQNTADTVATQTRAAQSNLLEEDEEASAERIIVTGSRIRRAEFSSASPVQVINGDVSRELGLFDAGEMLQTSNQAAGSQIDNTFGGFVLDNGPGSATIGFRGLGAERTLVLINNRRMAPAGVGGAPTSPDLNLVPGVMIERIENLLDGASTVYGSDAVAGVANVILKSDVEGFQIEASTNKPKGDGGENHVLSAMYGHTYDNGFVTIGAEYNDQKRQSIGGNPFLKGCEERIFEDRDGNRYKRYAGIGPTINGEDSCDIFPLTNRMQIENGFWGSVYNTPGFTNTGIPNFSESTVPFKHVGLLPSWIAGDSDGDGVDDIAFPDGNGDGLRDFDFQDPFYAFQQSDTYKSGDYYGQNKRLSVIVNGEHNFGDDGDTTLYYDALYASRDSDTYSPGSQLFQWVSAANPYNICNPNGLNGIDCFGVLGFGDAGPLRTRPIVNIRGDRDTNDIEVSQYRMVTGITGNLLALENIGLNDWYYDAYVSYSASKGTNSLRGISQKRISNALNTAVLNDDGTVTCGNGSDGCVPVNLFSDNIYQLGGGRLTAEEEAYLMVESKMETKVNQFVFNGYVGGDLFVLPWSSDVVAGIFGVEYRRDEIESNPNEYASNPKNGLVHRSTDKGADGSRNLKEAFAEIDLPLVKGKNFVEELTLTASGRWTKESFYDSATTYSLKGVYRPVEWLTIRGTKGTSYRAPNLRERFLSGTTGFRNVSDPCVVPDSARDSDALNPSSPDTYNAANDTRDAAVLAGCQASGVDPTSLGLGQNGTEKFTSLNNAEISTGGSISLTEEESLAKTFGFVIEQPFTEDLDLTFSITRFDIEVTNSIAEPSAAYSIGQCYNRDGNTAFCDRLTRDSNGKIDQIDASFINIGLITSKGMDYNLLYQQEFVVGEQNLRVDLDLQATRLTESLYDVLGTVDDNIGEPDYPEWRASAHLRLALGDFRFNWKTRFIGEGVEDDNDDQFKVDTVGCQGLSNDAGDPLECRPVADTEDYFVHNVSISYTADNYKVVFGVNNVFNEEPPKVDPNGSFSSHNIPLGVGYDFMGRTPFINFSASF